MGSWGPKERAVSLRNLSPGYTTALHPATGDPPKLGRLLICEDYPGMRDAFRLMLGDRYELGFVESPEEIGAFLVQSSARLLIWDLNKGSDYLGTLRRIRRICPALKILLVSGEFDVEFQIAAIRHCGLVRFLTKPWKSTAAVIEQIQVMLGDRKSSIRQWVLRVPIMAKGDA